MELCRGQAGELPVGKEIVAEGLRMTGVVQLKIL